MKQHVFIPLIKSLPDVFGINTPENSLRKLIQKATSGNVLKTRVRSSKYRADILIRGPELIDLGFPTDNVSVRLDDEVNFGWSLTLYSQTKNKINFFFQWNSNLNPHTDKRVNFLTQNIQIEYSSNYSQTKQIKLKYEVSDLKSLIERSEKWMIGKKIFNFHLKINNNLLVLGINTIDPSLAEHICMVNLTFPVFIKFKK